MSNTIVGTPGADSITGSGSNNGLPTVTAGILFIMPGAGNDTVIGAPGSGGPLFVFDESGDDYLQNGGWADSLGGGGNSAISGGLGNDTIVGGLGRDEALNGGSGNDLLLGPGLGFTLPAGFTHGFGSVLRGDDGNDTILGGFGFGMVLDGGNGADSIQGSPNNELIRGGQDGDTIDAATGFDTVFGEFGNDSIVATLDILSDSIDGGGGNDTIRAGGGNDFIFGGDGGDDIAGGAGVDVINGGIGANTISGGADSDEIATAGNFADSISGDDGNDTIWASDGNNTILGGNGSDRIMAGGGADSIDGGDIGDHIDAGNGANTINGGGGDDRIFAGSDSDLIIGGANDTTDGGDYIDAHRGNNTVFGGFGTDNIFASSGNDSLFGEDGNDIIVADGGADSLFGGNGNDTLDAGEGSDRLDGGEGGDLALAGSGNDTVIGGRGFDRLDGGADSDVLDYSGAGLTRIVVSVVQQRVAKHVAGVVESDTIQNFETFVGTAGADRFTGYGADETFTGGLGNDTIDGGDGFDTVRYDVFGVGNVNANLMTGIVEDGLGGTDRLRKASATNNSVEMIVTGVGADTLVGDADGNFLRGGHGADSIDGGAGSDHVDYNGDADLNGDGFGVVVNLGAGPVAVASWGTEGAVTVAGGTARDASGATDTLANIEYVRGTAFRDLAIGDDTDNFVRAMQGADTIDGGYGADFVSHRSDNDANGDGFGVVVNLSDLAVGVASWGSEGAFTLAAGRARDGWGDIDTLVDIEGAVGSMQNDLLVGRSLEPTFRLGASGFRADERSYLRGMMGADTLRGQDTNDGAMADYRDDIAGVVVRLDLGWAEDGWGFIDTLQTIAGASGSMMDDLLVAAAGGSRLRGRAGDDTLQGGAGIDTAAYVTGTTGVHAVLDDGINAGFAQDGEGGTDVLIDIEVLIGGGLADTLIGNAEDNLFYGGRGADTIVGGDGEDIIAYHSGWKDATPANVTGVSVHLGAGTARDGDGSSALGSIDRFSGIEHAVGSHLADTLTGSGGANSLMGAEGDDTINGGAGNDVLEGGAGADTLLGGTNLDTASYASSAAAVMIDLSFVGPQGGGGDGAGDLLQQIENIAGSAFNDTLLGSTGSNVLTGAAGNDYIVGGAGNDTIVGGTGSDTTNGGAGLDVFLFLAPGDGRDRLNDFISGTDQIQVVGSAFGGLAPGVLSASRFALTTPGDADDVFIFNTTTKILSYDADGNGAGAAVQLALMGTATFANTDIIVV